MVIFLSPHRAADIYPYFHIIQIAIIYYIELYPGFLVDM